MRRNDGMSYDATYICVTSLHMHVSRRNGCCRCVILPWGRASDNESVFGRLGQTPCVKAFEEILTFFYEKTL